MGGAMSDDQHPGKHQYELQVTIQVESDTPCEAHMIGEMLLEHGRERANQYSRVRGYVRPVWARIRDQKVLP
jgi:hypothetical protein